MEGRPVREPGPEKGWDWPLALKLYPDPPPLLNSVQASWPTCSSAGYVWAARGISKQVVSLELSEALLS